MNKLLSTTTLLVLFPLFAMSQSVDYYSAYMEKAGINSVLYRGSAPFSYHFSHEGTYYAYDSNFQNGEILYNGKKYSDVMINLNSHLDELILKIPESISTVIANKNFVTKFSYGGRDFINIKNRENGFPESGYYQLLYGVKDTLLKKIRKTYVEEIPQHSASATVKKLFETETSYFLFSNGKWSKIKNRRELLRGYPTIKRNIIKFIRDSRLDFATNKENSFVEVVKYADQNKQSEQ